MFVVIEMPALTMLQNCVAGILLVLSYVSIFHMISMLSSSKTTSAVVCILAAVFMMVFAGIVFSKLSQPEMITQAVICVFFKPLELPAAPSVVVFWGPCECYKTNTHCRDAQEANVKA